MTITLFITMLTIGAMLCALVTEAVKKAFYNAGKSASPNVIALINAVIIGVIGTAICYVLMDVPFTVNNVLCLILVAIAVWVGSMIGFDKVKQTIEQLINANGGTNDNGAEG